MGVSNQQNQAYNSLSNSASYASNAGRSDINSGTNFMRTIMDGDPSQIASLLSPEISAEKSGLQQDEKTQAMTGGRSGGVAASNAAASDKVHSDITNLIGSLRGNAANSLTSTGENLLGQGIAGTQTVFGDAGALQRQRAAQLNDIISSSAQVAGSVIGAIPHEEGSWQDIASNALAA